MHAFQGKDYLDRGLDTHAIRRQYRLSSSEDPRPTLISSTVNKAREDYGGRKSN